MPVIDIVSAKRRFISVFQECGSVRESLKRGRVSRSSHYLWLRTDPDYRARFEEAEQIAARDLEDEARRRAVAGVRRQIYHQGKVVGEELVYSDTLLLALLKAHNPRRFNAGPYKAPEWDWDLSKLTSEELDKFMRQLTELAMAEQRAQMEAGTEQKALPAPGSVIISQQPEQEEESDV